MASWTRRFLKATRVSDGVSSVTNWRKGEVFANSRDVAEFFEKRHDNVIASIDALIAEGLGGVLNFQETPYIEAQNGQTYRSFDMDRDGFTLLAMGFAGSKALRFKVAAWLEDKL
jgi:Rha family phage regulatory protein